MNWGLSHQCDKRALQLANRHYSRNKVGGRGFMPPGRQLVLLTADALALWGTSWPREDCVDRTWFRDAWLCTMFHSESNTPSSQLIAEAVAVTRWKYRTPQSGMVTMVDASKVKSRNPGYCFKVVGFQHVGYTRGGLHILQLLPEDMPEAIAPNGVLPFESESVA